ncbi:MAG: chlorophyll a/b-binding protein, partial [Synechococcaceae cyanobacterium]
MSSAPLSDPMSPDASPDVAVPATSAPPTDVPAFGWSAYAERVNGRFAMVGFTAVLLIEALSGDTF